MNERKYSIFLTEKCNKNCWHCDIPLIENPKTTSLENLEKLFSWNILKNITLTGGEIGLVDKEIFDFIFSYTDIITYINTNGLFLKKYPEFYSKAFSIILHPSIDIIDIEIFDDPDNKITYNYPITRDIDSIDKIITQHNTLRFNMSPLVQKHESIECFDMDFYKKVFAVLYPKPNVTKLTKKKLMYFILNKQINKKECQRTGKMLNIDVINNRIQSCFTSYTRVNNIELTKENLLNPIFDTNCELCKNCMYLYGRV